MLLEQVRVSGNAKQEGKADRGLGSPIRIGHFFGEGEGSEIADAEEGQQESNEAGRCRGFVEVVGRGLCNPSQHDDQAVGHMVRTSFMDWPIMKTMFWLAIVSGLFKKKTARVMWKRARLRMMK